MGWLKNFFKRIVVEAITEVLEPHIRVVVREEFENLEPRIRAIFRDEMRVAFEQEWEPRIRAIVREELRTAMEEEWVPRLQAIGERTSTECRTASTSALILCKGGWTIWQR